MLVTYSAFKHCMKKRICIKSSPCVECDSDRVATEECDSDRVTPLKFENDRVTAEECESDRVTTFCRQDWELICLSTRRYGQWSLSQTALGCPYFGF